MEFGTLSLVIDRNNFDVLSADTSFYTYMGQSRLYYTFDCLVAEEDREMFVHRAKAADFGNFYMRMIATDGRILPFYAMMSEGTCLEQARLMLIDVEQVIVGQQEVNEQMAVRDKILELYGDDLFVCDLKKGQIRLLSKYNIAAEEKQISFEEMEALLKVHVPQNREDDVCEFLAAIKTGKRYFEICVNGNLLNQKQEAKYTILRGGTVYRNGEIVCAAGYIQRRIEQTSSSIRKTELDLLTGVLSKSEITNIAIRNIDVEKRQNISIAIVDVDYFKKVNDTYGHLMGDETLKKVAAIMEKEVGNSGVVGRIGGDEFLIVFYDAYDLEASRERLRSIKNTIRTTFSPEDDSVPTITLSMGCAAYPKDADNYTDLFSLADFALYRAKEKGRNRYIIYDKEKHGTLAEIHKSIKLVARINSRGNMSKGDILCTIMDRVYSDELYPLDKLLDDYVENFEPQRITIYDAENAKILHMAGAKVLSQTLMEETQGYIHSDFWQKKYVYDDVVINDIAIVQNRDEKVYNQMKKQKILSCIHLKFRDKNGVNCILSLEAVNRKVTWNHDHMHYYRLMAKLLSQYVIK
ncbi:MAG: GGDEF domain-containing protein [Lachnospiraceae bacterium]|nr:GGDEF domain-containing protein [Lachnospiraceae bacterium]